ncbi:hypothetical protein NMG46_29190 [Mesorhizobium sp. LMG 17147]|uniref:hypothetical protein n=1 Tax=Mesorhizobium sp. LMG 17147 TaxID=2963091 RepID=UPI0020C9C77F|nr:hypothetical protein [Mesorhizobium sp. LMG 17147]MCP9234221.1 hypothetical protein [Mesorhizobium sp. LMG 17147]
MRSTLPVVDDRQTSASILTMDENYIYGERTGLQLVRMAIEMTCPAGVLPSEEAVNLLYGPLPVHEGEALAKAIMEVERLARRDGEDP